MKYLIAFGKRPNPGFMATLVQLAANDGVAIRAMTIVPGPGCNNLAFELDGENEAFASALTMALMPAKWTTTEDPIEGFADHINGETLP